MEADQARIALSEAMSLHDERLRQATARCRAAAEEMDAANAHLQQVTNARQAFIAYVAPRQSEGQGAAAPQPA